MQSKTTWIIISSLVTILLITAGICFWPSGNNCIKDNSIQFLVDVTNGKCPGIESKSVSKEVKSVVEDRLQNPSNIPEIIELIRVSEDAQKTLQNQLDSFEENYGPLTFTLDGQNVVYESIKNWSNIDVSYKSLCNILLDVDLKNPNWKLVTELLPDIKAELFQKEFECAALGFRQRNKYLFFEINGKKRYHAFEDKGTKFGFGTKKEYFELQQQEFWDYAKLNSGNFTFTRRKSDKFLATDCERIRSHMLFDLMRGIHYYNHSLINRETCEIFGDISFRFLKLTSDVDVINRAISQFPETFFEDKLEFIALKSIKNSLKKKIVCFKNYDVFNFNGKAVLDKGSLEFFEVNPIDYCDKPGKSLSVIFDVVKHNGVFELLKKFSENSECNLSMAFDNQVINEAEKFLEEFLKRGNFEVKENVLPQIEEYIISKKFKCTRIKKVKCTLK